MSDPTPLLLSVSDVCRLLNVSRSSFFNLKSMGGIPLQSVKLGAKLLYRAAEVKAWAEAGCPPSRQWDYEGGNRD